MIKLQNIEYSYDDNNVLDNINLSIHSGDFMGIVGADDSGKTTLLHILLGFKHPDSGSVSVFGQNVDNLSEIIRNNSVLSMMI